jgi:hypothetical protein
VKRSYDWRLREEDFARAGRRAVDDRRRFGFVGFRAGATVAGGFSLVKGR